MSYFYFGFKLRIDPVQIEKQLNLLYFIIFKKKSDILFGIPKYYYF